MPSLSVNLNVVQEDLPDFREGFLAAVPIPRDEDTGEPTMTEKEHLVEFVRGVVQKKYDKGKGMLGAKAAVKNPNIITVT